MIRYVILSVMLAVAILSSCKSESRSKDIASQVTDSKMNVSSDNESLVDSSEEIATDKVLIDNDFVRVVFVDLFEEKSIPDTCYIKLLVENKADRKIMVALSDGYANDESVFIGSGRPMTIDVGKKSENPFFFSGYDVENIDKLEFRVSVYDDENMTELSQTDLVTAYVKE